MKIGGQKLLNSRREYILWTPPAGGLSSWPDYKILILWTVFDCHTEAVRLQLSFYKFVSIRENSWTEIIEFAERIYSVDSASWRIKLEDRFCYVSHRSGVTVIKVLCIRENPPDRGQRQLADNTNFLGFCFVSHRSGVTAIKH